MLFDPRHATGPNATGLSQPSDGKPITVKKERKGHQDIPGINKPPPGHGAEWERKQRAREYRVSARREKRNRKADEKKQRKLNATILRRMLLTKQQTRNPEKYNKNAERNRLRAITTERNAIWTGAVRQAERLAAEHDPSGATFNVGPVVKQEDGTVISVEILKRREEGKARRAAEAAAKEEAAANGKINGAEPNGNLAKPENYVQMELDKKKRPQGMSKTQQKKLEALKPREPPQKPVIPEGYSIPEGEENLVALWDLTDPELERRVLREKRRKAASRKALRVKQKSGKAERRMARDEKRRVYRDIKLSWKTIKEAQVHERTRLNAMEEEERKRIAVEIAEFERKAAMDHCISLGFTLENTEGVTDVKPRALGMKGMVVDFDAIEPDEERAGTIRLKDPAKASKTKNPKRVDLGVIPGNAQSFVPAARNPPTPKPTNGNDENAHLNAEEFIKLDVGSEQQFQELNYNHKIRRKLRRAFDNAAIAKETLVRERALAYYTSRDLPIPDVLKTPFKPVSAPGSRILENGTLETAKQERVRARMELAEFNKVMKVLRRQAKQTALEAGLRKHAEVTGRIEVVRTEEEREAERRREEVAMIKAREVVFNNGPSRILGDDYGLGGGERVEVDGEGDVVMGDGDGGDSSDGVE
ncbi:MAG: hypothetical protein Q9195_008987 [Heterodermia aff. obscurata]